MRIYKCYGEDIPQRKIVGPQWARNDEATAPWRRAQERQLDRGKHGCTAGAGGDVGIEARKSEL